MTPESSKSRHLFRAAIGMIVAIALGACSGDRSGPQPAPVDSATLTQTAIAATLYDPIVPGKNTVYCAAFELAWGEVCDTLALGPVKLEGDPKLAADLNQRLVNKNILPASAYFVAAGTQRDGIVDTINQTLQSQFNSPFPPVNYVFTDPDREVLVYAFMQKQVPFQVAFEKSKSPLRFRKTSGAEEVAVKAFGIDEYMGLPEQEAMARQITVYEDVMDRLSPPVGIMGIATANAEDEMILARVEPKATLLETIAYVDERIRTSIAKNRTRPLQSSIRIPEIDVNVKHVFRELIEKVFPGKIPEGYQITVAEECIRFRLDNTGARVAAEAEFGAKPASAASSLYFGQPFLFWLRTKGQPLPYFAIWVGDPEVLVRD